MYRLVSILALSFAVVSASAQMDDASRSLLIEKLANVQRGLAAKDPSKVAVTLRLADLLSERARVESMKEIENGCTVCNAGEKDRKQALRLYTEVIDNAPEGAKAKVMIQLGHLWQMNGDEAKASGYYQRVLNLKTAPELNSEAHLALAEIAFKRHDFAVAKNHYQAVLENPSANSRGLAAYRIAWSSFNLGQLETALSQLETVLKTPALLTRSGVKQAQVDAQFQEEVSRDYATFLSKAKISKADVEKLYKLSPEAYRVQNVQALALDAERLGKKAEALVVWQYVFGYLAKPEDRLSSHVAQAQLQFDLGNRSESLNQYELAMALMTDAKACPEGKQCEEVRRRARQFVVSWNQTEKKTPSKDLLKAYAGYTAKFPNDLDMQIYAGQVAQSLSDWTSAFNFLEAAKPQIKDAKKLETVLLTQIEIAESSKDEAMMVKAYNNYLANSANKSKAFSVRYQLAHLVYDRGNHQQASVDMHQLAMDKTGDLKTRRQAADLSLDSLVILKDDATLQTWATEYAKNFKEGGAEYSQIAQKTVLTKAAEKAGQNQEEAYSELLKFVPADASAEDRIKYYKNKMILAEKLHKFPEAQKAAEELLKQPGLSAEDQELAWGKRAKISELVLDFPGAIAATEKLQKTFNPETKALKLALFSELAGNNSTPFYMQYLKLTKDQDSQKTVALELVRKSKTPEKELDALRPYLANSAPLVAELYTEAFVRNKNPQTLHKVLKDDKLKNTEPAKLLTRLEFLKSFAPIKAKLAAHNLDTSTDRKLAASIKARAKLLNEVEAKTKAAIASGDWTSQLVTIDTYAKETERFYQGLISAPLPQGLTGEEEAQYLNLLSTQAQPYQIKASEAKQKVEQFWKDANWFQSIQASWKQKALRPLISQEVAALKEIAPADKSSQLETLTERSEAGILAAVKPSLAEVQGARRSVFNDPLNVAHLERLLSLEKRSENAPMVQYLQTRIETLNKGIQ
jgi:hypothetical protein